MKVVPSMSEFATRLIAWQKLHGRHDLPWQNTRDPYAIWISEIMLQQTQVSAVIGYYQRFMQRFPTLASLAAAEQEEVLQYWSGLGYYSRARNLHNAAQIVMDDHGGIFPREFAAVQALPGIGRSTAAAILSFAFDSPQPILDGNVKRVFARHFLIDGWPGTPKVEQQMWGLAEALLPAQDMVAYTQGLMDLGATLCTRSRPQCPSCPLQQTCLAFAHGRTKELPASKPRKASPQRQTTMLMLLRGDEILLEKRPPSGIWGGLWSLPEAATDISPVDVAASRYGLTVEPLPPMPVLSHAFTHFKLAITPQPLRVLQADTLVPASPAIWMAVDDAIGAALPTPVRTLLQKLKDGALQGALPP
jgi:A/G-specific adenine glycosylase